eukprot:382539-Pleurochrysis_carterae.AAC.1
MQSQLVPVARMHENSPRARRVALARGAARFKVTSQSSNDDGIGARGVSARFFGTGDAEFAVIFLMGADGVFASRDTR